MLRGLNFILTQKPPNKIIARKARWDEREERQDGGLLMMPLICVSRNSNCVRGCRRDYCMHRRRLSRAPLLPKTPAGWEACLLAARHRPPACMCVCLNEARVCASVGGVRCAILLLLSSSSASSWASGDKLLGRFVAPGFVYLERFSFFNLRKITFREKDIVGVVARGRTELQRMHRAAV